MTSQDAWKMFGITRLASVIERLRKEGHPIFTELVPNGSTEYARYHLRESA